jgi:hypothetical protein
LIVRTLVEEARLKDRYGRKALVHQVAVRVRDILEHLTTGTNPIVWAPPGVYPLDHLVFINPTPQTCNRDPLEILERQVRNVDVYRKTVAYG